MDRKSILAAAAATIAAIDWHRLSADALADLAQDPRYAQAAQAELERRER